MQKWKHIFVYPLLFSWLVIFTHDIIPHYHPSPHVLPAETGENNTVKTHSHCNSSHIHDSGETKNCHFAVDIPAHSSMDFTFIDWKDVYLFITHIKQILPSADENTRNITPLHLSQNHLRAPPLFSV
ncbi:MAG: hypothetical protein ACLFT4_02835 [Bacteroidales bacterium]